LCWRVAGRVSQRELIFYSSEAATNASRSRSHAGG
jgi:hypothetical protein